MFTGVELLTYILSSLILLLVPGPAVLYVIARSLEQGRRAGLASAAGTAAGGLFHVIAAVVGLSAVIMASATLFAIVKYLGALYLIYLGVSKFFESTADSEVAKSPSSLRRLFFDGLIIEAFNPKVAAFFLSFLPQFIHPERGQASLQILTLGLLFCLLALLSDSLLALASAHFGQKLMNGVRGMNQKLLNRMTAATYIVLGAASLLYSPKHKA